METYGYHGLDPEEVRAKVDQFLLGEKIKEIRRRGEEIRLRLAWLDIKEKGYELEERYNHYHDPHTGRFASGAGGGEGLYYSMGKGKGEIIEAYSSLPKPDTSSPDTSTNDLTNGDKNGNIILPTEDKSYGNCSKMIGLCKKKHIEYNQAEPLEKELTEQEIIDRVGGADKTKGSCASLAYAYAANKAGYDVLDYRGGEGLNVFSDRDNTYKMSQCENSKWIYNDASSSSDKLKFIRSLPEGEEYIFMAGEHSAIVRQREGKAQYLELQKSSAKNGWKNIRNSIKLNNRFGQKCKSSGYFAINVNDVVKSYGFKEMCGYINTAPKNQMKGKGGYAK